MTVTIIAGGILFGAVIAFWLGYHLGYKQGAEDLFHQLVGDLKPIQEAKCPNDVRCVKKLS